MIVCSVVFDGSNNFGVVIGTALIDNIASFSFHVKLRNKRNSKEIKEAKNTNALYIHIPKGHTKAYTSAWRCLFFELTLLERNFDFYTHIHQTAQHCISKTLYITFDTNSNGDYYHYYYFHQLEKVCLA